MHFPSASSSSLITIFCLLLVIISLFLPGASAQKGPTRPPGNVDRSPVRGGIPPKSTAAKP
ncbi:uncharacterized protein J3R85_008200 [Psidium guajava]|nr:uncharacterized protein J3R85_008200 [Psidium guajava]